MNKQPNRFLRVVQEHPSIFILILALSLSVMVVLAYHEGKKVALDRIERALDDRVNTHKYYLLDALGKFSLAPGIVATLPHVRQMLLDPTPLNIATVNYSLDEIAAVTQADRLFIMNAAGTVVAASTGPALPTVLGNDYSKSTFFQQAIAGHAGRYVGLGAPNQVLSYFMSRPVMIGNTVSGVAAVRVSLSLEVFRSVLKEYWRDNGEVALIADEHGVIFMSPIDQWLYRTIAPLPAALVKEIDDSRQYGDNKLRALQMQPGDVLSKDTRMVRFADIPNQEFLQKSYSIGEIGDRIYLHVNASRYWEQVISFGIIAALAALAALLLVITGFQSWSYRVRLVEAAIRDPLTGLYTRLYMDEWIQTAISAHLRDESAGFALVIFDLDKFKRVNDTYGHLVGDAVLIEVGKVITSSVRAKDLAVRYGGEELAVFVSFTETAEVLAVAERVRKKLDESGVQTDAGRIKITVSAGIAYHINGETSKALFQRADKKLYEAKEQGRNRICA